MREFGKLSIFCLIYITVFLKNKYFFKNNLSAEVLTKQANSGLDTNQDQCLEKALFAKNQLPEDD